MEPVGQFVSSRKLVVVCVSAAFGAIAPAAYAAPVFGISASYNLGVSTGPGLTLSPQTACGDNGSDALEFTGSGANSIGIHTYGCDFGSSFSFGSRSSGENTYFVDGKMSLTHSFSGDEFTFTVEPGQVGSFGSTGFGAGEFQSSMMTLKLSIDGSVHMDEALETRVDAGGALTFDHDSLGSSVFLGSTLATGAGYASFQVFGGTFTISGLGAGDHTLIYDIATEAAGNVVSTTSGCLAPIHGRGDIEIEATAAENGGGEGGNFAAICGAGAQTGDPFPPLARAATPEPGSLALLGLGLAGLLGFRGRRNG